jgi:hypothetical protein
MKNAMVDYKRKTKGKTFGHIEAWEIVRKYDKWFEQPIVGQTSSSNSEKRRKSYESSNDNVETIIPDLNDDTTPTRKKRGKKIATESSTKNSVAATFENYAAKKSQIMEESLEKKRAKDELAEKLMAAQLRGVEEKAFLRALKFYNDPHDHIVDPVMQEIALAKKREYAAKYGWPCNF